MAGDEISTPKPVSQPEENTAVDSEPEMSTPKPLNQQEENTIENSKSEILGFNMGVDMVDIFVGQTQTHFRVHKDLLCSRVPYFKAMFKGAFMESQTQSAKFPEEAATTVALFIEWVYTSRLRPIDYTKSTATSGPIWDRILLYGFAEKLCLPELCDYLMSNLITTYGIAGLLPSFQGVILAYNNTNERSPLRKFMVQALCITVMQKDEGYEPSDIMGNAMAECPDLVVDLLWLMRPDKPVAKNPTHERKCKFHIHKVGKECPHKVDIL